MRTKDMYVGGLITLICFAIGLLTGGQVWSMLPVFILYFVVAIAWISFREKRQKQKELAESQRHFLNMRDEVESFEALVERRRKEILGD